jgi:hypothetical protein
MAPPDESFKSEDFLGIQIDPWLVENPQLALPQGIAELIFIPSQIAAHVRAPIAASRQIVHRIAE